MLPLVLLPLLVGPLVGILVVTLRSRARRDPLDSRALVLAGMWGGMATVGAGSAVLAMAPDGLMILPMGIGLGAAVGALLGFLATFVLVKRGER